MRKLDFNITCLYHCIVFILTNSLSCIHLESLIYRAYGVHVKSITQMLETDVTLECNACGKLLMLVDGCLKLLKCWKNKHKDTHFFLLAACPFTPLCS